MNKVTILTETATKTPEGIEAALRNIAKADSEFCGEAAVYYTWERAEGFPSNAEYLIDKTKDIENPEERIRKFCEEWLSSDEYYDAWDIKIEPENEDKLRIIVSYATIIE